MNTLAKTLIQAARSGLGSDLESLNETLSELGWAAAGSTAPPYCRHFEADGVRLNVYPDEGRWFVDILFKEVYPEDVDELGEEAVTAAVEAEEGFFRQTTDDLMSQVTAEGVTVESTEGLGIDRDEFVLLAERKLDGLPFVLGIANIDIDMPVSVMAR
ncbi:hypothetical protein ABZ484_38060, partial [Streptomyces sp. NPDC006393]|uniref:hypothetical protein n=1 Tax=Streptomyces sp. NPDC006393 TaxID=3156763 RepID=UPI0033C6A561